VEALSVLGRADTKAVRRGLKYLRREQFSDGSWFGRWGVNYIYGVGSALPAFRAVGRNMSKRRFQLAGNWLVSHQNEDGGWGETAASYDDPSLAGRGDSTASQTAWGLLGLLSLDRAADDRAGDAIGRGVGYLVDLQEEDGQWNEPQFTGTGFPGDFYIKYHLYRNYWPLSALGRYSDTIGAREER
jgi:squalene-hopene/tetraprenyl-beta-curcumene cyclase